jgi:MFS superfamily sulfate permease-like transporter
MVNAGAVSVDHRAVRTLRDFYDDLTRDGVGLLLVHAEASLQGDLGRHCLIDVIGADHVFDMLREALAAVREHRVHGEFLTTARA